MLSIRSLVHMNVIIIFLFICDVKASRFYRRDSLTTVPDIPNSYTSIDIAYNKIENITDNDFRGLSQVTSYIYLHNNRINDISYNAFNETRTSYIKLHENPLKKLPAFSADYLTTFDISYCEIENTSLTDVLEFSKLKTLNLNGNPLYSLPNISKARMTLEDLKISYCKLDSIPKDYFSGFNALKYLYIESNDFVHIGDFAFEGLVNLETLDLDYNKKLETLGWHTFSGLTGLTTLYLTYSYKLKTFPCMGYSPILKNIYAYYNEIDNITSNCTAHMRSVEILNIKYNKISSFELDVFQGMNGLKKLYLYRNNIKCVRHGTLAPLKNLTHLYFYNSYIELFGLETCDNSSSLPSLNLPKLEYLDLSYNQITRFPNLTGASSLRDLGISYNKLSLFNDNILPPNVIYLNMRSNKITHPPSLKGSCGNLYTLHLAYNLITNFTYDYFDGCPRLESLYIYYNLLTKIPNVQSLSKLRYLYLYNNKIAGPILESTFLNKTSLYSVKLSRNQITYFDEKIMQHLPNIRYIYLEYNNLTTLGDLSRWCVPPACSQTNLYVYLYNSPLKCDYRLCWIQKMSSRWRVYGESCTSNMVCPAFQSWEKVSIEKSSISLKLLTSSPRVDKYYTINLPSLQYCAFWCQQSGNCFSMEFGPPTGDSQDGICKINY